MLLNAECELNQIKTEIGSGKSTHYIYKYGYIWRNSKWEQITFTPSGTSFAVWLVGRAGAGISLTAEEMEKDIYFLAYVCTWTGTTWKCGCRDALCAQNYW